MGSRTIVNSINGAGGTNSGHTRLQSADDFSASLEDAKKKLSVEEQRRVEEARQVQITQYEDQLAFTGQVVHDLASGDYSAEDIAAGKLASDVETVINRKLEPGETPEEALINFLKESD